MGNIRLLLVYALIDRLSFVNLSLPPEGNLVVVARHDTPLEYDSSASIVRWSYKDTDDARGQNAIAG